MIDLGLLLATSWKVVLVRRKVGGVWGCSWANFFLKAGGKKGEVSPSSLGAEAERRRLSMGEGSDC